MRKSIWIGFDPREAAAFAVARDTIRRRLTQPIPVYGLVLDRLRKAGLYTRPTEVRTGSDGRRQMWDTISDAPMATEFSNSRFLVPRLAESGFALFLDCDILVRGNLARLFEMADADRSKAAWCVKHQHAPTGTVKMDGQAQTAYSRKNWSSAVLFNVDHASTAALTVDLVNALPGRDLHRFCWLRDEEIGELDPTWNWLAGESEAIDNPKVVHHTNGSPCMLGYENAPFADEWREALADWAQGSLSLTGSP